jgi:hypothetical protein
MNISLGKNGNLNLSQLIKSNIVDDDGLEDVHFYKVAICNHQSDMIMKAEVRIKQARGLMAPKKK